MTTEVTVTIVFTDLVNSTELAVRLGPRAAEEVRTAHFSLLRDALVATGGSEVKNLGDGLMVAYSSLGSALDGAVAMQQAIELHNRKATEPLGIRIGLSSGDAVTDDGDYFGEPVVEAARLCAHATAGQIVTTDLVRRSGRRTEHRFADLGPVELKGLPEPAEACEVLWETLEIVGDVPLPRRLAAEPDTGVVGREVERQQLLEALKAASAGSSHRVVMISGEPGVGKTTLAGDLARRAHAGGATVLYGRCDEDLRIPYQPFVEAFGEYVATAPESALLALDPRQLSELSRLVPEVRARIPGLSGPSSTDGDTERYLLYGATSVVLRATASTAPVVVVLDDLHWADGATVSLLRHLVGSLHGAEVLVIGTYRDSDLSSGAPLTEGLAALRREPVVERLAVPGLDDHGVIALLESIAHHEMNAAGIELAHAVRRETNGNPFFTTEVLRHLAETGAIRQDAGRWVAAIDLSTVGLPESVREVVGQRVRRLGEERHRVLAAASVIGREFDLGLLAQVVERDEDHVLEVLEVAAAAAVVDEVPDRSDRFTFTHALVQHTLYEELSASRRARTHRRIGEILEAWCGDDPGDRIGELARHFVAATKPREIDRAIEYARRAGERALATLAPDEAIRWFRQALELIDTEPRPDVRLRLGIVVALGNAQRQAGDPDYRQTLLDAASEASRLGDTEHLVAAVLSNVRGGGAGNAGRIDTERVAMLEQALRSLDDTDSRERAWLLATLASLLSFSGERERLQALTDTATAIARRLGDDAALVRVNNLSFVPLWVPEGLHRSLAATREAVDLAERIEDPLARCWASQNLLNAMASAANREGMDAAMEATNALAHEIGQPFLMWMARYSRSWYTLLGGDSDAAERAADEALEIGIESGQPDALAAYGGNLANIRWQQGRVDELLPIVEKAAIENPGLAGFQAAQAMALCEAGRFGEAMPLLANARAANFYDDACDYTWLTSTALWADVAAWLGDGTSAAMLYKRLLPFEAQGVATLASFTGTVGQFLARLAVVLGARDDALALFEQADTLLRQLRAPFWHARNQLEWARLLVTQPADAERRRGRHLLVEASETSRRYGCAAVERRADELVASL